MSNPIVYQQCGIHAAIHGNGQARGLLNQNDYYNVIILSNELHLIAILQSAISKLNLRKLNSRTKFLNSIVSNLYCKIIFLHIIGLTYIDILIIN